MPHNLCYEFGPYRFDLSRRVLTCAGETISLGPKATEILVILVLNAGQLVAKDELLKQVWPNTFVEEANVSQNIFILRQALGDDRSHPRYIETVVRRGYRFIATVATVVSAENKRGQADQQNNGRPIIAVLPFINATDDPELEYLADGVTDNIINSLSRVSKLRVMSRNAVFRHKTKDVDAQQAAEDLGANVVLVGRIDSRQSGVVIAVELVEASTGWQLWGQSFDSESKDILQIQENITRHVLATLKLKLTNDEEKRVTARYTENPQAYQSYLEGRYHWSRYTRKGIEKAIGHFRHAIEIDPNYALAYTAIIDCYLRLATNYLPPEDDIRTSVGSQAESAERVKLRFEWDWKAVERELRRANELRANYPSVHQWYFAYRTSKQLYKESISGKPARGPLTMRIDSDSKLAGQIPSAQLAPTEEVQILCSVARDQIAVGNFEAAYLVLRRWCVPGKWPKLDSLNPYTAADLLLTLGTLLGCIAGTKQLVHGHKQAEVFLAGSVALFEQLGIKSRSVEAQMELARCYYRQGLFDLARETISDTFSLLPDDQIELRTLGLVTWGMIERESGRLKDSLIKLREAASLEVAGRLVTCRCFHDLATTLKELAISEQDESHSEEAKLHFLRALYESEALGHHRYVAAGENNLGFFLLSLGSYEESEKHLLRSRRLFESVSDSVRGAQVDETLARLYIETKQYPLAKEVIERAVETLELTDSEAFLAEALTTNGVVASRLGLHADAKRRFEGAYKVAERCGDHEGAGRALLLMFEELGDRLDQGEKLVFSEKMKNLFAKTQQSALLVRVEKIIANVAGK
jgi:TolB-like protein